MMSSVDSKNNAIELKFFEQGCFLIVPQQQSSSSVSFIFFFIPSLRCVRADPEGGMWCDQKNKHEVLQPEMFSLLALPRLLKN